MAPRSASLVLALVALAPGMQGCGDDKPGTLLEDASFGRRVFRPPPADEVRAVPPHNIHRNGVGPYELKASLQDTLELLPTGPRLELFEAKGLFNYRLMRSEQDALVIGARRGSVDFISVLDPDIARTESGVGVGAGVSELVNELGELRGPHRGARDARIVTFSALPNTRFIVESGKVVAAITQPRRGGEEPVVEDEVPEPGEALVGDAGVPEPPEESCGADALVESRDKILAIAKMGPKASMVTSCVLSKKGEALLREGRRLVLVSADGGKPRVVGNAQIDGLNFAFLHKNGTGRAAVYVVSQRINALERAVVFRRLRADSPTLQEEWAKTAMQLKASAAKWIGATVDKTDFLVEVQPIQGGLELGGIFVHRARGGLRNVVPLEPVVLPVGQGRPGKKVDKAEVESPAAPDTSDDAGTGAAGRTGSAPTTPAPGRSEKKPARP